MPTSRLIKYRNHRRGERGDVLTEFSLASIILVLFTFAIMQLGFIYFAVSSINNGAAEGARYGSVHPDDTAAIRSNVWRHLSFADNQNVAVQVMFPDGTNAPNNRITVTATYTIPSWVPGLKSIPFSRSSTMRIEPRS
jgi:uncharacterized protein (UPF0333 family)